MLNAVIVSPNTRLTNCLGHDILDMYAALDAAFFHEAEKSLPKKASSKHAIAGTAVSQLRKLRLPDEINVS
jgi:hypothetical protein